MQRLALQHVFSLLLMCCAVTAIAQENLRQPSTLRPATAVDLAPVENDAITAASASKFAGLEKPLQSPQAKREITQPTKSPSSSTSITTVVASLAVVLGLFFVVAWCLRRGMPQSMSRLPSEVVEQLGRAPLSGKQNMHLLRVGGKLVLVAITPFGVETLTEVTDSDEVERLTALCKQNGQHGPSAEFRAVMRQFETEPAEPGFLGNTPVASGNRPTSARRGGYRA